MSMPNNLVLVRHGESEGNKVQWAQKTKEKMLIPAEYYLRHTSHWRLTQKGIEQAKIAGEWIKSNIGSTFYRYYTSSYLRAKETSAYLNLPGAKWYETPYLGERNWGILDQFSAEEKAERFEADFKSKEINIFYWSPPRGESILQLCLRVDRILDTLHRECEGKDIVIVCHGEVMWAFCIRLERLTVERYIELDKSKDPHDRIHNCQIIHYTRINPNGKIVMPYLNWKKSVCPTDLSLSSNDWQEIARVFYSNEELLGQAEKIPRLID